MEKLQIRMFGEFSLQSGTARICDRDNRSRKVWHLLAYLICRRGRTIPQNELIESLWGDDPASDNPENTLKVTLHRARNLLDRLWDGAGHQLILRQQGGYTWSTQVPTELDAERFETLCRQDPAEEDLYLSAALEAIGLYQGEFLSRLSSGTWVIPIATHYHSLYVKTVLTAVPMLLDRKRCREAADICRAALPAEPYNEILHQLLMRALLDLGDSKGAMAVYEELSQLLLHDFGVTPHAQTRAIYQEASHTVGAHTMAIETVLDQLLEPDPAAGALLCSFEAFRVLCHAEARAMVRSGKATHVALLSVTGEGSKALTKRSLDTAMTNLGEQIRLSLRRGDALCRCSASQYVIMLPQANYENSCVVCRRVINAFSRRYPYSPTRIHFIVQPLSTQTLENP